MSIRKLGSGGSTLVMLILVTAAALLVLPRSASAEVCPNEQTRVADGSAALSDCRAWEMVSPAEKFGAGIEGFNFNGNTIQAAEDGSAVTYGATAPTVPDPAGNVAVAYAQLLSRRGPDGWSSQDLQTPLEERTPEAVTVASRSEYMLFSSDLSEALVQPDNQTPLPPLEAGAERTIYLRNSATGDFLPLVTKANVRSGAKFGEPQPENMRFTFINFRGGSPDLSHVVFQSPEALTENATRHGEEQILYEWAGGQVQRVSILPDGEQDPNDSQLGQYRHLRDAVSDSGSRVVWSDIAGLYLRDLAADETVKLDAPQPGSQGGPGKTVFQLGNSEESRIFFTSTSRLTVDSTAGENLPDLYVYEAPNGLPLSDGKLKDLTTDGNAGEAADMVGSPLGISSDGTYAYFVANGALAGGAVKGDCREEEESLESAARCNLYMMHFTGSNWEPPRLLAVLSGDDTLGFAQGEVTLGEGGASRVSPDGEYVAFMSDLSLTGYDNHDLNSGKLDEEVFLYNTAANRLVCASCNPEGRRPLGIFDHPPSHESDGLLIDRTDLWGDREGGTWLAANIASLTPVANETSLYQSRALSDSGRLFFNSSDGLVPGDSNAKEDVYEYEPTGVGGCRETTDGPDAVFSQASSGCVGLISSGTSDEESAFMDASATGGDVFFLTSAGLAPQDLDGGFDMYDAHECTVASPCSQVPALPAAPCNAPDACRGALPAPETFGSSASAAPSGSGNVATPWAPKPTVSQASSLRRRKLQRALELCHRRYRSHRSRRAACERQAGKSYRATKSTTAERPSSIANSGR